MAHVGSRTVELPNGTLASPGGYSVRLDVLGPAVVKRESSVHHEKLEFIGWMKVR